MNLSGSPRRGRTDLPPLRVRTCDSPKQSVRKEDSNRSHKLLIYFVQLSVAAASSKVAIRDVGAAVNELSDMVPGK
jgi:hypothetical protein